MQIPPPGGRDAAAWRERGLRDAALAGDATAWGALYDEAFAPLDAYVSWRCGGRREWTDEVLQETWLVAVDRLGSFDPARAPFTGWLCGIAANVIRNQLRKRRRVARGARNSERRTRNSEDPLEQTERQERVAEALAELPQRYERALRAKYLDRMSVAEIAAAWGESEKAVESLLTRARQAFRAAYESRE
ncbi:MAG TPA: sigma-70 family RNA polymerase sigma factor [Gemmataceae bacterium]